MLPFQVALEELCIQKSRSYQRAEDRLWPAQESQTPPGSPGEGKDGLMGDSL